MTDAPIIIAATFEQGVYWADQMDLPHSCIVTTMASLRGRRSRDVRYVGQCWLNSHYAEMRDYVEAAVRR